MERTTGQRASWRAAAGVAVFLVVAGAVLAMGLRIRALEARNEGLVKRFTEPHPGMLVPSFRARSAAGDSVVIGAEGDDRLQVLFFVSSACAYCLQSLATIRSLDSALSADTAARASVYLVDVDSAGSSRDVETIASSAPGITTLRIPTRRMALLYRVRAVPQLIVLDSAGRAVLTRPGAMLSASSRDSVLAALRQHRERARPRRQPGDSVVGAP